MYVDNLDFIWISRYLRKCWFSRFFDTKICELEVGIQNDRNIVLQKQ